MSPDRVQLAFAAVPRRKYLPASQQLFASHDTALQIGFGQTNSQPTTVRNMLRLLAVEPGDRVLDVGAGSAWTTALLAVLVGEDGEVVGVERVPEILAMGRANLGSRYPCASLHLAEPGVLGWPRGAPYDRVLVSADATSLPMSLVEQLVVGGVLVLPVNGTMLRVVRTTGEPDVEKHGSYSFVPLIE